MGQTIEELNSKAFTPYYGECVYAASDIDMDKVAENNGIVTLYVQGKTAAGTVSPIETVSVGYDIPYAYDIMFQNGNPIEGQTFTNEGVIDWTWSLHNASVGSSRVTFSLYVDEKLASRENHTFSNNWTGYNSGWINIANMNNGEHTIRFEVSDAVGDSSTKEVHFTIDRPLPVISETSLTNGVSVEENEPLVFNVSIENAKYLRTMRLISDGNTILSESITNNTNVIQNKQITVDSRYLKTGSHSLYIELEDNAGNVTRSDDYGFTVSGTNAGPTITGFEVTEGQVFSDYSIETWNLTFEDNGGVKSIEMKLDDSTIYEFSDDVYQSTYQSIPLTVRFRVPSYTNGEHVLSIKAYDFAGNETSLNRTIVIDKELPTATLSLYRTETEYERYRIELSSMSWIYDGCIMIDEIPVKYYFINASASNDNLNRAEDLYYASLPAGTHTVKARFTTQGGDVIYSNELQITVDRQKDTSSYGLGKTWNEDGSLRPENSTRYLWGFNDESMMNHETISDGIKGQIKNTTDGIGGGAASMYYNISDIRIPFFSSEWTMEFWMKDEYASTDTIQMVIRGLIQEGWGLNHSSSSTYSYWYATPIYVLMNGDTSYEGFDCARASRADYSNWHHYALVSTGERFEVYMDGVMVYWTSGDKPAPTVGTGLYINMETQAFIDELRITADAKSVDELWDYVQYVKSNNLLPE